MSIRLIALYIYGQNNMNLEEEKTVMGNIYGYVRVSSRDQNEDRQIISMREMNIPEENIYIDKQSGKDFNRPQYKKLMRKVKPETIFTNLLWMNTLLTFLIPVTDRL